MEKDQRMPDGTCHGKDLPDRGCTTGVTDRYGADNGAFERGFTDSQKIGADTKNDR